MSASSKGENDGQRYYYSGGCGDLLRDRPDDSYPAASQARALEERWH
jgi:hypothetical protein